MYLNNHYSGLGMARPTNRHQMFIKLFLVNTDNELCKSGFLEKYFVASEIPVSSNRNDLTPDIVVLDNLTDKLLVAVEITTHRQLRQTFQKCIELAERFPETEFWIFDYEQESLYFVDDDNETPIIMEYNGERSKYFQQPFMEYFYRHPIPSFYL